MRFARRSAIPLLAALLAACAEQPPPAPEARPVRTLTVEPRTIDDDRQAVGEIRARFESDLGFRVGGKVVWRGVDVGVTVKEGEVLGRLDEQDYRNRLRGAEADVASAEASLTEARAAEARQRQLLASGTTTQARFDEALRALRAAEAKLVSAKAALDLAADQVAYTVLKADWDGVVTAVGVEPGQVVSAGQMVVRLARPEEKDAVFSIAEAAFRNQPAAPPEVAVALLSDANVTAEGVVREVSPVADPATRTYRVKVALRNPPRQMRFGMSVVGRLKIATAPVVVLPLGALYDKAGAPAVWIYRPESGSVALKLIGVLRYEAERAIVGEGLDKGDIVVTAGVNRLREGQKVRLAPEAARR